MAQISQMHVPRKRTHSHPKLLITQIQPDDDGNYDDDDGGEQGDNSGTNVNDSESEGADPEHEQGQQVQSQSHFEHTTSNRGKSNGNTNPNLEEEAEPEVKPKRSLFSCEICDATFVTSLSLKRHNLVFHEDQETIPCSSCHKTFYKQDDLNNHVSEVHNDKIKVEESPASDISEEGETEFQSGAEPENQYQDQQDEAEDPQDQEGSEVEETTTYAHFANLCQVGDEDDDMDDQPESDPFAEDGEDGNPIDAEDEEGAYNQFLGADADPEDGLDTSQDQNELMQVNGNSLIHFAETGTGLQRGSLVQYQSQPRSLLRKPFNQTRWTGTSSNGVQGNKSHICPECGVGFVTRVNMQRHMLSHGQDRPHKCQLCDKGFVRKEHLFKHLSSVHSGLKFTCEFCGKDISRKDHLLRHIRHVHPSEYLRIPPELLNAQNLESLSLQNLRAAGFEISDKALNSMQPKPKKPYLNCDMCPATFTLLNDLYTHQSEAHSDIRKYKCPDCPKAFKRREHLTKHEVLHSGDKKFSCRLCVKSFPRKDALADHIRRLHTTDNFMDNGIDGLLEYPCNFCDKVFLQQPNLVRHLRNMHRITANLPNQIGRPITSVVPDPMNLGVGRIAPKLATVSTFSVAGGVAARPVAMARPAFRIQQHAVRQQSHLQAKPKPILPKQEIRTINSSAATSLLQAQQHLNKISGGKSSITISAVPLPATARQPIQNPAARVVPASTLTSAMSLVPPIKRPSPNVLQQPRLLPTSAQAPAIANKIAIKKISEYMKTTGVTQIGNIVTLPGTAVVHSYVQEPLTVTSMIPAQQPMQNFPCSYCNAVYSDEKIFRIHMNSHNANMN